MAPFDAIFCMAVLQRTPHSVEAKGLTDLTPLYPFQKFEAQLREFDEWLKPGGVLVIHYTQYRFGDSPISEGYTALAEQPAPVPTGPRFGPDGHLIGDIATPAIFLKQAASNA